MATNGWYVSKIITDLQEGKVDEFVKKEGKWFNYIKGEETTFTNAADNSGTAGGNLDFSEFTVQGIGSLSTDATTISGTTPALGGNLIITFSGGNNWNTTGFSSYNISNPPATGTFTIFPNAGYGLSADSFTALSVSFGNTISSITFADTGIPGDAANTVVGTITFDTSVSIPSNTNVTDDILLAYTAPPAIVVWEGTIIVNGIFENSGNTEDQIYEILGMSYDTLSIASSTSTQLVYNVTKNVFPGQSNFVFRHAYQPGPSIVPGATPTVSINVPAFEQIRYSTNIVGISPTNTHIEIEYTPANNVAVDDLNEIVIDLNSQLGNLNFSTSQNPFALNDNGNTQVLTVYNNLGNFTVSTSGDISSSISNISVLSNFSAFTFDVSANTTGSNITGTITVTSVSNPSISDTLNVEQGIQDTVTVTAAIQQVYVNPATGVSNGLTWSYVYPPANSNAGWFTSFSGTGSNPIIPAEQTTIEVKAEFDQPSTTTVSSNFSVVYSDPNNTGWINSFGGGGTFSGQSYVIREYIVSANPTGGAQRTATITHPHYSSPTLTDSITITQEAGYDSSVNTFEFKDLNLSSPYTIPVGTDVEVDHNAQTVTLHAGIPYADTESDNVFNQGQAQIPTIFTVPNAATLPPYYYSVSNFLDSSLNGFTQSIIPGSNPGSGQIGTSTPDTGVPWWSNLTIVEDTPLVGTPPNVTFANTVTHKITFNLSENFNIDQSDPDFPIDRTFSLQAINPENPTPIADDTINIIQRGQPRCAFNSSASQYIIPSSYLASNGVDLLFKANGSTPLAVYRQTEVVTTYASFYISSSPGWAIGSPVVTSTGNSNEYNVHLNLEENFSGDTRRFKLAIYHATVSFTGQPTDPLTLPNTADEVIVEQEPAIIMIYLDVSGNLPASNYFNQTPNLVYNQIQYFEYQIFASGSVTHSYSVPVVHNGPTPIVDDVEYDSGGGGNFTTTTPAWVDADPVVNSSGNLILNINQTNTSGNPRVLKFKIKHGGNQSVFEEVMIINPNV